MNLKWFLGIDISKEWIDVYAFIGDKRAKSLKKRFTNSISGLGKFNGWLKRRDIRTDNTVVCMEHTGTYGLLLIWWLAENKWFAVVEPAIHIKRSLGLQRGKNDQVDAHRIAEYAYTFRHKLQPYHLPAKRLMQLKQLLTYRDQMVKIRTSVKNSIKSHAQYEQIIDNNFVSDSIGKHIAKFNEEIKVLDNQLEQLLMEDPKLKANYKLARSVKGIGLIVAAFMIASTQNFTAFPNSRKYACYVGLAPFENSSGMHIGKTHTSHLANRQIKSKLLTAANSAILYSPELRAYYQRKIKEGKNHKSVANAVACKLVNHVFAVIKRQTPYVITYENKIA